MTRRLRFLSLLAGTFVALALLRLTGVLAFNWPQVQSIAIFTTFIYATLLFPERRLGFAAGGIALLMACNRLSVGRFVESANLAVIVFLVGTFLVIGFLEENLFFEHVVGAIIRRVGPRPRLLMAMLVLTATVSSALVGEVAATLFMAGAVLHLCDRYRLAPLPFVMTVVFAVNCGSAASSVGPIGVTIALRAHLTFLDFLRWAAPVALAASLVSFGLCRWWFAPAFRAFEAAVRNDPANGKSARPVPPTPDPAAAAGPEASKLEYGSIDADPVPSPAQELAFDQGLEQPTGAKALTCWLVLICTLALFICHPALETLLGLERDAMLVAAALVMGGTVLLLRGRQAQRLLENRVDWWTLAFFVMLFAGVGTLEQTGVTRVLADRLRPGPGGGPLVLVQTIGWATGGLSAFLDNLLAVATFLPVVDQVRTGPAAGPCPQAVYWMMLFGGTFMGNMTVIGSTANIIACGMLEKRGHGPVRFADWLRVGLPVSLASMLLATVLLGAQTGGFRRPVMPALPAPAPAVAAPRPS